MTVKRVQLWVFTSLLILSWRNETISMHPDEPVYAKKNGSIDGPGGLVYEIRIQANERFLMENCFERCTRKIPIENITSLTCWSTKRQ